MLNTVKDSAILIGLTYASGGEKQQRYEEDVIFNDGAKQSGSNSLYACRFFLHLTHQGSFQMEGIENIDHFYICIVSNRSAIL
jgi:hypothetical protein